MPTSSTTASPRRLARGSMGTLWSWQISIFNWYTNLETRTRPMSCLGDLIWHQKMRTSWLSSSRIICLPTRNPHLRSMLQHVPNLKIMAPTLVMSWKEPPILETSLKNRVTIADMSLKIWQTIAETSQKIWHRKTSHSRLVPQTWVMTTSYQPSSSIKRSRRPKEKTPQPLNNGNGRTALSNKETSGPRRAPSLLWETMSLRGG